MMSLRLVAQLAAVTPFTPPVPWYRREFLNIALSEYMVAVAILIAFFIIARMTTMILRSKVLKHPRVRESVFLQKSLDTLIRPVSLVIILVGLMLAVYTIDIPEDKAEVAKKIVGTVIYIVFAYLSFRLADILGLYLQSLAERTESLMDDHFVMFFRKGIKAFILVIFALLIITWLGLSNQLKAVLAGAGLAGLALALAAQESLSNLYGSATILGDRPFKIGERIVVGDIDGYVEEIGLRSTRIRTLDGHLVTIPNSTISKSNVVNISARPFIRRVFNIGITYDTPPEKIRKAVQIVKDILSNTDKIIDFQVFFSDFLDFSLNITVRYKVDTGSWAEFMEVGEKVNLQIVEQFNSNGIEFAFPTQTLYLKKTVH